MEPSSTHPAMTSERAGLSRKTRMLRALRRETVDRLPTQSNYTRAMGRLLAAHFGIAEAELPDRLGNHLLRVDIDYRRPTNADGSTEFDWWGAGWDTRTEGYWHAFSPLKDSLDLDRYPWPDPNDPAILRTAEQTIVLHGEDYFIAPNLGMCLFERAWSLRGFDALLMDMLERTEWVEELLDRIAEIQLSLSQEIRRGWSGRRVLRRRLRRAARHAVLPATVAQADQTAAREALRGFCGRGAAGDSPFRRRHPGDPAGPGRDRLDHAESGAAGGVGARLAPTGIWGEAEFLRRSFDPGRAAERHGGGGARRDHCLRACAGAGRDRTGAGGFAPDAVRHTGPECGGDARCFRRNETDWTKDSQARAEAIAARFRERFAGEPELWARAPGRVDLMGSHTDYNLGFVLTLPISRDTWIAARRRDDGIVRVHSMNLDRVDEFRLDAIDSVSESRWRNYVRGVAATLQAAGFALTGCDAVIHSTVPVESGLSSSAALGVRAGHGVRGIGRLASDAGAEGVAVPKGRERVRRREVRNSGSVFVVPGARGLRAAARLSRPFDAHGADCRRDSRGGVQHDEPTQALGRRIRAAQGRVRARRRRVGRARAAPCRAGDTGGQTARTSRAGREEMRIHRRRKRAGGVAGSGARGGRSSGRGAALRGVVRRRAATFTRSARRPWWL